MWANRMGIIWPSFEVGEGAGGGFEESKDKENTGALLQPVEIKVLSRNPMLGCLRLLVASASAEGAAGVAHAVG